MALVAMALVLEIETSWLTCAFIGLGVLALAGLALIRGGQGSPHDKYWVKVAFSGQVVGLLVAPVIAPVLVLRALLDAYKWDDGYEPSIALADEAVEERRKSMVTGTETLPWADTMALVAAITSTHNPWIARRVASHFHLELKQQRKAAEEREKRKRALSSHGDHAFEGLLLKADN